ncbi:hypothetical protein [Candidatus Desulfovibrio trichonymphae]|uniref:hypothetical protein n=1 Tax=Candidatus Desulfovibrio trichonymphae TaxID=1725232 RepID=UPI001E41B579|nr:hypothetical protein [Candidatus Desulfovibrio trichonymphae]
MNSLLRCCLGALPLLMLCTAACSGGDSRDKAPPAAPVHAEPVKRADMPRLLYAVGNVRASSHSGRQARSAFY